MIHNKTFAIVGGDPRFAHLANALAAKEAGYKIYALYLDRDVKLSPQVTRAGDIKLALPQSDCVIFPLPMLGADGKINTPLGEGGVTWEECFEYILPGTTVVAGKVTPAVAEAAEQQGVTLIDYLEREEFAVLNAVPTA